MRYDGFFWAGAEAGMMLGGIAVVRVLGVVLSSGVGAKRGVSMPRAIALAQREEIVRLKEQERVPLTVVAAELRVSVSAARNIWRRYRKEGRAGLRTRYERCKHEGPRMAKAVYEAALEMRREHPYWGGGIIRVQLRGLFPDEKLPCERTLQRWFRWEGLQRERSRTVPQQRVRATEAHETWQMDVKEQIETADGKRHCLLDMADEATGALLGGAVFSPRAMGSGGTECGA